MNDRPLDGREPENHVEERPDGAPATVRLASAGRGPGLIVGLIAVFVAIALIKPWSFGGGSTRPIPRPTPAAAAPSADPLAALRLHCQEPDGWRVYSREHWATLTVHSWRSLDPASAADGPLDPRIPIVAVVAEIDGLGYCSPWTTNQRPPADAQVDAWVVTDGGHNPDGRGRTMTIAETIPLQPVDPSWPSVAGNLYGPPDNRFDPMIVAPAVWPGGRYVFAVRAPGYQRWWGVDVEPPPNEAPSPNTAPGERPAPSPTAARP